MISSKNNLIENRDIKRPLSIAVADDHAMIRVAFKLMLKESFILDNFFEASNGDELYTIVKKNNLDIVVMDINMPNTNAQGILENILLINPDLNVLVFSVNKEEIYGKPYLRLGARGYLEKDTSYKEIIKAIKCILTGGIYIKKEMQDLYLGGDHSTPVSDSPYQTLGKKELEVMRFLVKGDSLMNIAKTMNLSPSTIASHKQNILSKLRLKNLIELREITLLYPI